MAMANITVVDFSPPDSIMVNVWFKSSQVSYQLHRCSTVGELRQRVATDHGVPPAEMRILLGGRVLDDGLTIQASGVGMESTLFAIQQRSSSMSKPSATVTSAALSSPPLSTTTTAQAPLPAAVVSHSANHPETAVTGAATCLSAPSTTHHDACRQQLSDQYYVYCKVCGQVRAGRLRVKCSVCEGGAVLLDSDPGGWEDVLTVGHLTGSCQSLQCEGCQPMFYFKCAEQHGGSGTVVALRHIMPNRRSVPCMTCEDVMSPVVVFPCEWSHVMCVGCFKMYCSIRLKERGFQHTAQYGYTLPCPAGCSRSYIQEQHHFCVLGEGQYERYKDFAAEECLMAEGGVFCPRQECASGFLLGSADTRVVCPHCKFVFCRRCRRDGHDGTCRPVSATTLQPQEFSDAERAKRARWEQQTADTIQQTTKGCPGCGARTERDGGCMHMRCARCDEEWCWLCVKPWDRDCQGAHWFG
ncbi:E3 ubiquitin-protein ligase parkin-like [Babylonia areolata]|uniref:E3 ubiquitin-protein ligase parkin-like n=1 Tax=Babylonia areolata TaxID=304850 RepID=UPI003FCF86A1